MNKKAVTILLIEDNPFDQEIFSEYLNCPSISENKVLISSTIKAGIEVLKKQQIDILFLDLSLPDALGISSFNNISQHFSYLPVVILTGLNDLNVAMEYIQAGAQDYLIKGEYDEQLLNKVIVYSIERKKMLIEKEHTEQNLLKAIVDTQEEERNRFAKDLHDGLGQILSAIKINMNALEINMPIKNEPLRIYNNICELVDSAIVTTRNISHNLMPQALIEYGLVISLKDLRDKINHSGLIQVELEENVGDKRFINTIEVGIFRIVQELLQNTLKHAKAKNIKILLDSGLEGFISCVYQDNGKGIKNFNIDNAYPQGAGIKNISNRVESLKGYLNIVTVEEKGFYADIRIPVKK